MASPRLRVFWDDQKKEAGISLTFMSIEGLQSELIEDTMGASRRQTELRTGFRFYKDRLVTSPCTKWCRIQARPMRLGATAALSGKIEMDLDGGFHKDCLLQNMNGLHFRAGTK